MSAPRYAFSLAVVGDESVMAADELWRLLDYLVAARLEEYRVVFLSVGRSESALWATGRGHSVAYVPEGPNPVKRACEIVLYADALVVLGDPAPWGRLIDLAKEAGVAVRVFRERPRRIPAASRPAWDVGDEC